MLECAGEFQIDAPLLLGLKLECPSIELFTVVQERELYRRPAHRQDNLHMDLVEAVRQSPNRLIQGKCQSISRVGPPSSSRRALTVASISDRPLPAFELLTLSRRNQEASSLVSVAFGRQFSPKTRKLKLPPA